jgi:hypothetical protein
MTMTRFRSALAMMLTIATAACSSPTPRAEPPSETPAATTPTAAQSSCSPSGNLQFVCNVPAPEDIVLLPGSSWLVASGMTPGSGLHLVSTQTKSVQPLAWSARPDPARYGACPAPLDTTKAVLHGLSLRAAPQGHFTLYATNHGGRESIEIFDVDAQATPGPAVTWIGCVVLPDQMSANSVAAFSDGTLVATVLMLPGKTFEDIFAGRNTGIVLMWTPGSAGFTPLPGTELAGNNGIETSPDDREFFVAASGSKRVVAFSRANPGKPLRTAQLAEFGPDNVRFVGDELFTAGMLDAEPSCGGAPKTPEDIQCPRGYVAVAINPQTMAVREVARGPAAAPYAGTATALQVGDELWLSSFNADRLAYRKLE